ncbi:hypothetical protein Y032_0012g1806 [Ancylostoma ceylanicum]|uniref:Uncharacterized protein n=1 Tax=Ancylostoma ceylanicum TaxID=53326 RepID=A0A016VE29_9BILA|nr:hypothetical protein Y032_0012g1806 [Ancylostoma ceylanicum]
MLLCFFRIFDVLNELEFDLCEIELDLACFCHTTSSRRNVIHLVSRVIMVKCPLPPSPTPFYALGGASLASLLHEPPLVDTYRSRYYLRRQHESSHHPAYFRVC